MRFTIHSVSINGLTQSLIDDTTREPAVLLIVNRMKITRVIRKKLTN